jgi:glycosyltransferase involved in cell wall biosynthesis
MNRATPTHSRISAIVPTYNCASYLADALDSILGQTRRVDEIIVVNDGSTDATAEVLRPYRRHIIYLEQPNAGQAAARNRGLNAALGAWVAFLDADDIWMPDKIERQLDHVANDDGCVCVHTGVQMFGERSGVAGLRPPAQAYDLESLLTQLIVLPSTVFVKGGLPVRFREWATTSEDSIYFAEIATYGRFSYIDEPLVRYRKHPNSVTSRRSAAAESLSDRLRWIDEQGQLAGAERERLKRRVLKGWDGYLAPLAGVAPDLSLA